MPIIVISRCGCRSILIVCLVVFAGCSGVPIGTDTPTGDSSPTASSTSASTNGTLEVHFINVGQSVATLVVGPTGETMLVDSGHFRDDGEFVLQYLQRHDIERIDYFVTSHNDADHIGGNAAVIEYYETEADGIGAIYDPGIAASTNTYGEYLDAVEQYDVTLYETREGDAIPFEDVDVQVMGPPDPYIESEARNENSVVLKLSHGRTSFLFTGDAEDDQEQYLVDEYGSQLGTTVFKAGHHGSKSSTSEQLLDAVQPKAVVISSAYDSQYDHPNKETLQRLAGRSIPTYWTAMHGDIVLVSDGQQLTVQTQRDASTDATELRNGEPVEPGTTDAVERRVVITGEGMRDATVSPRTQTVVTDGGTPTAASRALVVSEINADAAGDDQANLNDEYVVFENTGAEAIDLSGWTVSDEIGRTYTVPEGVVLEASATITLHTGAGTDTETDLYWDAGSPVWNNRGDTVVVTNSEGDVVLEEVY